MSIKIQVKPTMEQVVGFADGTDLQQEAADLESQGHVAAAEHKYLEAIRAKEAGFGPDHYTTATSYDSLGELYLKTGQVDKAEEYLNKALRAREDSDFSSDLAMTRDSLGKLFEMKGDLQAARDIRLKGLPDNIACGNSNVSSRVSFTFPPAYMCNLFLSTVPASPKLSERVVEVLYVQSMPPSAVRVLPANAHFVARRCFTVRKLAR